MEKLVVVKENEMTLNNFEAWSGAVSRLEKIIELDIVQEATDYIMSMFEDGKINETTLNDILWFEMDDFIEGYEK